MAPFLMTLDDPTAETASGIFAIASRLIISESMRLVCAKFSGLVAFWA